MSVSHGPGIVVGGSSSYVGEGAIGANDVGIPFVLAASANIAASGANTTAQLTAPSGKSTSDFVAGRIQDDENPCDAINVTNDDYTEIEWCLKATADAEVGGVYEFAVFIEDTPLDTYTVTPQWTISVAAGIPFFMQTELLHGNMQQLSGGMQ